MSVYKRILQLALPMILANISTPLLGLVDTAVMGHLTSAQFLAAVALAGVIFNFIYWGFGFLRMGTTGLVAQAYGQGNRVEIKASLFRAALLAGIIAGIVLLLQTPIAVVAFSWLQGNAAVENLAWHYYQIRIWSTPATLMVYVLTGWFLGMQNVKAPLAIVLITNSVNILLDIVLVNVWQMDVAGVALASVIAEYSGLMVGLSLLWRYRHELGVRIDRKTVFERQKIKALWLINRHLFIRTLSLIFAFAFFTAQATRLGDVVLAANTVLMNFQTFMAYALDGFAHAAEALVGKAIGRQQWRQFREIVRVTAGVAFWVSIAFSVLYAMFGEDIIRLLTSLPAVQQLAQVYLPWMLVMPLIAMPSYLFDGVFVGATWSRAMQHCMLLALFGCFLPVWYLTQDWGNQGLWLAMTVFMLARSVSMGVVYRIKSRP